MGEGREERIRVIQFGKAEGTPCDEQVSQS